MRRREFMALLAAAAAWPPAARAQQPAMPVVGFLNSASPGPFAHLVAGFRRGLEEEGFVEGQTVAIEYRWAEGEYDRLPALAAELVARRVNAIAATGGERSGLSAKSATSTIPIVFAIGGDPVKSGLVAGLNRPAGNVTGVTQLTLELGAKRLGLLHEMVPGAKPTAVLINPNGPHMEAQLRDVEAAAERAGVRLVVLTASADGDFDSAFATLVREQAEALLVTADPFFNSRRDRIVALAARHRIPAMYEFREFVSAGGLMSYGTNLADAYRQVGVYVGRILKGAKPADLPVVQSAQFELVVNLKAARQLGLTIPQSILVGADEVME